MKGVVVGLMVSLAVVATGLAAMEAATRWLRPQQLVRAYTMPDERLGTRNRPGSVYHDTYGANYWVRINAHGLRMDEAVDLSPQRRRVMVYGDSFTFGWAVEYDQSFFARIKRAAETVEPGWQLLNAGTGGYATGHVKLLMDEQLPDLRPAALVYFFNNNDIVDNAISDPDYRVAEATRQADGSIALTDAMPFSPAKRWLLNHTPYGWLNQHSQLFVLTKDVLKQVLAVKQQVDIPDIARDQVAASNAVAAAGPAYTVSAAQAEAAAPHVAELVELSAAHVRRLVQAAHGLPLLIVWVPSIEEMFTPDPRLAQIKLFRAMRARLAGMAAQDGGFAFVDSTALIRRDPAFLALRGQLHFNGDGHFTPEGNQWFAELTTPAVIAFLDHTLRAEH